MRSSGGRGPDRTESGRPATQDLGGNEGTLTMWVVRSQRISCQPQGIPQVVCVSESVVPSAKVRTVTDASAV
jgi:hypothetical protein